MEIKGIKYIAPLFDADGYGQAARGYVLALHQLGVPITLSPVSFAQKKPDLGEDGKILYSLVNKDIDYNIVVTHLTPNFLPQKTESGKFNVSYSVWETDRLPKDWAELINDNADLALVGSSFNVKVYMDSGVEVPVRVVPHGINLEEFDNVKPYRIKGVKPDAYKFYFINQFTERKHPLALLKAYWHAFSNGENVALVLKTYRTNYSAQDHDALRTILKRAKQSMPLENHPPIYLIPNMLSRAEILGLHKACDCFISLDRGEGFGLSGFEAGASSKPIIVTNFGGVTEYANDDTSYSVDYFMTPVFNMSGWYSGDQMWAEPNLETAVKYMRHLYEHKSAGLEKGMKLRKYIEENLTWDHVGNKMLDILRGV